MSMRKVTVPRNRNANTHQKKKKCVLFDLNEKKRKLIKHVLWNANLTKHFLYLKSPPFPSGSHSTGALSKSTGTSSWAFAISSNQEAIIGNPAINWSDAIRWRSHLRHLIIENLINQNFERHQLQVMMRKSYIIHYYWNSVEWFRVCTYLAWGRNSFLNYY